MKTTFVKYYLLIGILLNTKRRRERERERKTIDSDSKWDSQEG